MKPVMMNMAWYGIAKYLTGLTAKKENIQVFPLTGMTTKALWDEIVALNDEQHFANENIPRTK